MSTNSPTINNKALSVREIIKIGAASLSIPEKIKLRDLGPPRPNFALKRSKDETPTGKPDKLPKRKTISNMQAFRIYRQYDWICGDDRRKVFYCFPCLLMGTTPPKETPNPSLGFGRIHFNTEAHVKNALSLAMLGTPILCSVGFVQNGLSTPHNKNVERNRQLLNRIMKGLIDHANLYEYVLNGEQSWSTKLEPIGLIDFLFKIDPTLKEQWDCSTLLRSTTPKDLKDQLLRAAFDMYQSIIIEEIKATKFVALITEETTDLAHKDQVTIILRYVLENRVVERFWTFVQPTQRDAKSFSKCIANELDRILLTQKEKLISQSHMGGVIFSPLISDVHRLITEEYKNAIYVHYHAYKLTLVMERAVCQNSRVREFFANLYGMYEFFERQPKVLQAFFDTAAVYSEGSFEKGALTFIHENKMEILNFMILLHTDLDSSPHLIREADVCEKLLLDDGFQYFLSFFYYLMADVNVFYDSLQNSFVDSVKIAEAINEFLDEIRKTKDAIAVENSDNDDKTSEAFLRAFAKIEICNVILKEIKERFSFTNHWEAHILFKSEQYYKFHGNFPENILRNAIEYFKFKSPEKLRIELETLYIRSDLMICRNAHDFLWVFHHYKLKNVFDKTTALLHVILTIPTMLMEAEDKITAARRVRRAAALAANDNQATALTMLLAERDTLASMSAFPERSIDMFIQQQRLEKELTYS